MNLARGPSYSGLPADTDDPTKVQTKPTGFQTALFVSNLLGAFAHATGIAVVGFSREGLHLPLSTISITNEEGTATPYIERLPGYDPVPVIRIFFGLSLAVHTLALVATVPLQCCANPVQRWYMRCLYNCIAPWRWLEYFFSASTMIFLAARLLSTSDVYLLTALTALMATTMTFGWATELYSCEFVTTGKPRKVLYWELTRFWKPRTCLQRLSIHVLGYVPYITCWRIILALYDRNAAIMGEAAQKLWGAVYGSVISFSIFGLVQLVNQLLCFGPSVYWLGEVVYVVLSFASKANLGFAVYIHVLANCTECPIDGSIGLEVH